MFQRWWRGSLGSWGGERRQEEVIATRLPATALKSPRFLCGRPFLLRLQARHPLIHELYEKCGELFNKVGSAINRPVKEPTCASEVASFNLDNEENLKPSWQAAYMDVLKETLQGVPVEEKKKLYREFKAATPEQLEPPGNLTTVPLGHLTNSTC